MTETSLTEWHLKSEQQKFHRGLLSLTVVQISGQERNTGFVITLPRARLFGGKAVPLVLCRSHTYWVDPRVGEATTLPRDRGMWLNTPWFVLCTYVAWKLVTHRDVRRSKGINTRWIWKQHGASRLEGVEHTGQRRFANFCLFHLFFKFCSIFQHGCEFTPVRRKQPQNAFRRSVALPEAQNTSS